MNRLEAHQSAQRVTHVCPDCGEQGLYADASVYWDADAQGWQLSDGDTDDRRTLYCGDCGAETSPKEARHINGTPENGDDQ